MNLRKRIFLSIAPVIFSCGTALGTVLQYPYPNEAPTFNFRDYARGNLGILSQDYGPLTLTVAYRVLTGHQVSNADLAMLSTVPTAWIDTWEPENNWNKARDSVLGAKDERGASISSNPAVPCQADAFNLATKELQRISDQFGNTNPLVNDWARTQDEVFAVCAGKDAKVPSLAADDAPGWFRDDRRYQRAAALFYANRLDESIDLFGQIAEDPHSRWHSLALYLVQRARLAKAQAATGDIRAQLFADAANSIDQAKTQVPAQQVKRLSALERRGRYTANPEDELRAIESRIATGAWSADTAQDLKDYVFALNRDSHAGDDELSRSPVIRIVPRGGLTDWLYTMQADPQDKRQADMFANALRQWQSTHSEAWLVASLAAARSLHEVPAGLLDAATSVSPASPAFAAVQYRLLDLRDQNILRLHAAGKNTATLDAAIVNDIFALLALHRDRFPGRDVNRLHQLWAEHTRSPAEFMQQIWVVAPEETKFAANVPEHSSGAGIPVEFADDIQMRMSIDQLLTLWEASNKTKGPAHDALTTMLWTRAALLQRDDVTRLLATAFRQLHPKVGDAVDEYLDASAADKPYWLTIALLRDQGSLSAVLSDGGWVPWNGSLTPFIRYENKMSNQSFPFDASHPILFQSAGDIPKAKGEIDRLNQLRTGSGYMSDALVRHVHLHPFDLSNATNLARFVETTRYANETRASRAAFRLLHRFYFFTPAAHQTKYYF
ncbi:hypothetical protein [Paraburkholderia sp. J76]|uniref:hypothetical protein n=1 Tax=Paraburkholderia sp. J76 TaxID=2805439 RepID=UPI002ABDECA8|nr:hypothetical protein [Paraburkholderia sp. J76]